MEFSRELLTTWPPTSLRLSKRPKERENMRIPTAFHGLSESRVTTHTSFCSLEASHQAQLQPEKGNYGPPHEEKETAVSFLNHRAPQSKGKTMSKGKSKGQNIVNYRGGRSMTKNMGLELSLRFESWFPVS